MLKFKQEIYLSKASKYFLTILILNVFSLRIYWLKLLTNYEVKPNLLKVNLVIDIKIE